MDPRTPVIVGSAQQNVRDGDAEPIALMAKVTEAALADAGANMLRDQIQSLRVIQGIWPYKNPGSLVAAQMGLGADVRTGLTPMGGNGVYDILNETAASIQSGDLDAAIICSAETMRTRRRDKAAGRRSPYLTEVEQATPDDVFGEDVVMDDELDAAAGVFHPVNFYAMAESAHRHSRSETPEQHLNRVSALWARGSAVAATNPHAWLGTEQSVADVAEVNPGNRMVAAPYRKLMTSNINVDQGAAVIVCSAEVAESAGVAKDRWVFPWSGAGARDHIGTRGRWALNESPAMRIAGNAAMSLAGLSFDDLDMMDLYSCFPIAVQVAQQEFGLDTERQWTISGGLTFAGGPMNSYCLHALSRAVDLLRERPAAKALLTGNGGYFSKHSFSVLGSEPCASAFRSSRPQDEVDALPRRQAAEAPDSGVLEAYTVTYDRNGSPDRAILSVLDQAGNRTWANSSDAEALTELLASDHCGAALALDDSAPVQQARIDAIP